jgi:hypothetical protein
LKEAYDVSATLGGRKQENRSAHSSTRKTTRKVR